jgi:cell division protease FtsH
VADEKKTPDFEKEDWIDIRRKGSWHTNYEQQAIIQYLEVEDYRGMVFAQERVSVVDGLYVRFSLEDFLKEREFEIEKAADLGHEGDYPPSYANIEYEYQKYKSCLYVGCFFLKKDGIRYILDIDHGPDYTVFRVSSRKDSPITGQNILTDLLAYSRKNNFLKGQKMDAKCKFISFDRAYTWDDLVLDDKRKDEVRQNLANIIDHSDVYEKNGLTIKRGLIFHGSPGTGKTLLGKILCNLIDWTFVWVTPRHLQDARDVTRIVSMCRDLAPTILFLEDIDLFGGNRHQNSNVGVLGELMNQLDGIQENRNIITIATTNNVEVLEKALLKRPGRFDRVIEFGEPRGENIIKMLKLFSNGVRLDPDVDFDTLAKGLNGLTGAQVKELVNLAILYAIDGKSYDENKILSVKTAHFEQALPSVKKKDFKSVGFTSRNDEDDDDGFPPDYDDPTERPCL